LNQTLNELVGNVGIDNIVKVIVFIFGAAGWVLLFLDRIAYRRQKDRLNIYQASLSKLDEIQRKLSADVTGQFIRELPSLYGQIMQNPGNPEAILNFTKNIYEKMAVLVDSISIAFAELNNLRLVASEKTIAFLDQYRELSLQQAKDFGSVLEAFKRGQISGGEIVDGNMEITAEAKALSNTIGAVKVKLERQMREDIGYGKWRRKKGGT
jgi:hypothetical protein